MKPDLTKIKKILCIKPRGIGDIVLSTIILDNLKSALPTASIHYLTESFAAPAVENNPLVGKIHTIGKKEFIPKAALKIRKEKYDLVIDMWSNPKSAQLTFLSGARYRVGYGYRGRKYAYNLIATSERGSHHSAEHNLELLKPLGIPVVSKNIHYYISEKDKSFADRFFQESFNASDKVIGVIPAGGWESKRCDKEKWVEICRAISTEWPESRFLILWGPGDEKDAVYIINEIKYKCLLAPETSVPEMSALISKCHLILANDSGPMHIAAALKIPVIGIFGPTDPKAHGPYSENSGYVIKDDLHCIICNKLTCPYNHECMKELDTNLIVNKMREIT